MNNNYYVYAFLDPFKPGLYVYGEYKFDYEPFYIGKGTGDRVITSKIIGRSSTFKRSKLISLKNKKVNPIVIKIIENISDIDSRKMEIDLIKIIGRRDRCLGPLVNLTDGGDGRKSSKPSPETIDKLSKIGKELALKRREMGTDKHTIEMINHLSEINKGEKNPFFGKHHDDKVKEDQSIRVSGQNHPMFGKKHSEETINRIKEHRNESVNQDLLNKISAERNSKSVLQYSLDGDFIDEYSSIKEASIKTGLSESLIGKTCRGVVRLPRKFIFKFKNDSSYILNNSFLIKIGDIYNGHKLLKRNKKSVIVDINGEILTIRSKEMPIFFEKKKLN